MRRHLWTALWYLAIASLDWTVSAQSQSPQATHALPRYQFTVGEELVYREESHDVPVPGDPPADFRTQREGQWQVWVLGKNGDGSWRLLLRHEVRLLVLRPKRAPEENIANRMLARCDLFADGRILPNATLGDSFYFQINPSSLFVPLPPDAKAMAADWSASAPVGERTFRCSIDASAPNAGPSLVINCAEFEPSQAAYGTKESRRCVFDIKAGRLREFTQDSLSATSRRHWHERTTVSIESVSQKPGEWIDRLKQEAEKLFVVRAEYERQREALVQTRAANECKTRLTEARNLLTASEKSSNVEAVREQYAALLKLHDRDAKWNLEDARHREELYSAVAANWELSDFNGAKHRLKDYRGNIVVLDFWYRGCSWCTKALPQIKEVAERYRGKPVAVLGMNIDTNDDDARFVIREMDLRYVNLKAKPAEPTYRANRLGYPVLYILDQTGRVRDIHEGYSRDLAKRVSDVIDRLLRDGPPRSK
jgi:peroxiredoxin